jgi:hypothetical protein
MLTPHCPCALAVAGSAATTAAATTKRWRLTW